MSGGSSERINLAAEPDFRLGELVVVPSACKLHVHGREDRVEPKVMEVLVLLTRAAGRTVTRDELIASCWDGRVVSDDAVNRIIAKVRQLARDAEPPHFTLETVPKVGFRLSLQPQLAAETPEPTKAAPPSAILLSARQWGWLGIAAVAVIIAVLAFAVVRAVEQTGSQRNAETPHVVVSAVNVLQTRVELHRLAELTTTAIVRSLSGAGVRTSMSTPASGASHPEGAPRDVMLAGSADFDGTTYHVNITMSDRQSARVLWSGSFQRGRETLRGLEEEVAYDVAAILHCAFRRRAPSLAEMPLEVLSVLMQSCEGAIGWRSGIALEVTQRLIALAPSFADARAWRAIALDRRAGNLDYLSKEAQDLHKEANAEAQTALKLDPTSVAAYVALGEVEQSRGNFAKSEHHFRRALQIDPENSRALDGYGRLLRQVGRVGAARETFARMPAGPGMLIHSAFLQAMNGDAIAADQLLQRLAILRPSWERGARYMITAFWTEPSAALLTLHQFQEGEGARDVSCLEAHLKTLRQGAAERRRGLPESCAKFAVDWKIRMLARQGDVDGAYEMMGALPNSRSFFAFLFYPEMKAFRHDVRFMPMAESLGLLRYWRETDEWPDFCAEPQLPYDCRTWRGSN